MVNCFMCSPELYEYFKEEQVDQIFIKFSSEKKTLKKSEFIKKIRDKINLLFHFVISLSKKEYSVLKEYFPSIFKSSFYFSVNEWPEESFYNVGKKIFCDKKS